MAAAALALLGGLTSTPPPPANELTRRPQRNLLRSNGEWAMNDPLPVRRADDPETWTVNVSCVSPIECSGGVTSDLGWTGTSRLAASGTSTRCPRLDSVSRRHFRHGQPEVHGLGLRPRQRTTLTRNFTSMRAATTRRQRRVRHQQPEVIELPVHTADAPKLGPLPAAATPATGPSTSSGPPRRDIRQLVQLTVRRHVFPVRGSYCAKATVGPPGVPLPPKALGAAGTAPAAPETAGSGSR